MLKFLAITVLLLCVNSFSSFSQDSIPIELTPTVVEIMPEYPGGEEAMIKYISGNLVYPQDAINQKIGGKVIVGFIVKADGSISDVTVVKSSNSIFDNAAIDVIKRMPAWKPGKQRGQNVDVHMYIPIKFTP